MGFTNFTAGQQTWFAFGANEMKMTNDLFLSSSKYVAPQAASDQITMSGGIPCFWIFSDVVQDQHVGSKQLPLLRVVANNAPEDSFWIEAFDPYYLPVNKRHVNTITIYVCSEADIKDESLVHLQNPVLAVLHFRPLS